MGDAASKWRPAEAMGETGGGAGKGASRMGDMAVTKAAGWKEDGGGPAGPAAGENRLNGDSKEPPGRPGGRYGRGGDMVTIRDVTDEEDDRERGAEPMDEAPDDMKDDEPADRKDDEVGADEAAVETKDPTTDNPDVERAAETRPDVVSDPSSPSSSSPSTSLILVEVLTGDKREGTEAGSGGPKTSGTSQYPAPGRGTCLN